MTPRPPGELPAPGGERALTREVIQGEMADLVRVHEGRRRLFPRALLVGLLAGLVSVAFRAGLVVAERLRDAVVGYGHAHAPWGVVLPVGFGAVLAGLSVLLVQRVAPEAAGSGVPHLKAVLHHLRPMLWRRIVPTKFLGGILGIGAGLALGREGPTIQMGGAIGQMLSGWLRTTARERQTLIAAGAGAGLAAAFNAPLSGLIFVLEELQRDFSPAVFSASFIAAITADVIARWFTGQSPVFHVAVSDAPPIASLPAFAVLGLAAGLLGVVFNRGLVAGLGLFRHARRLPPGVGGAVVGAGAGLVAWFAPPMVGTGAGMLEPMFAGKLTLSVLVGLFLLRFVLSMFSYGSGAPGGIFAPLLILGALLGLVVGDLARRAMPSVQVAPVTFAVVGMAAYFAAIVRAPLTAIVLIVEMTGCYELMLALLVACLAATATAEVLGDLPIYERLLERELERAGVRSELKSPLLLELSIEVGSPFEGREVCALALPPGCVLVTLRRGREEHVPTPEMRLEADDHLVLMIDPSAAEVIGPLREGSERARRASTG